jgi:hypothetical protein
MHNQLSQVVAKLDFGLLLVNQFSPKQAMCGNTWFVAGILRLPYWVNVDVLGFQIKL